MYGGSSASPAFEGTAGYNAMEEDIKPHVGPYVLHEPEGVVTPPASNIYSVHVPIWCPPSVWVSEKVV